MVWHQAGNKPLSVALIMLWKEQYNTVECSYNTVQYCNIIKMTSWWARWRLKSPASGLFIQPFIQARSKKTSKLRVTGLCEGNSPVTGEFPAQGASNAENVSIWWRHHVLHNVITGIDAQYGCLLWENWPGYNSTTLYEHISILLWGLSSLPDSLLFVHKHWARLLLYLTYWNCFISWGCYACVCFTMLGLCWVLDSM